MLTNSRKLPTAIVMLSETVLTSGEVESSPADCCCPTNVDTDEAGSLTPSTTPEVVAVVVVVVVVVDDDDGMTAAVLGDVWASCRGLLVVVIRSLRAV